MPKILKMLKSLLLKGKKKKLKEGGTSQLWSKQLCAMYCPEERGEEIFAYAASDQTTFRWGLDFYQTALQIKLSFV